MKLIKILLFAALTVNAAGCLDIQTTINVNPDGTGTLDERILMSTEIISMLSGFATSFSDDSASVEPFSIYNEDELKNKASVYGEGVQYMNSEGLTAENMEGFHATYSFSDINKLKLNQDPDSKVAIDGFTDDSDGDENETEENEDDADEFVTFSFVKGNPSELIIQRPIESFSDDIEETESEDDSVDIKVDVDEMFLSMLKDMNIAMTVHVNGNIIDTDAAYVEGSDVTLMNLSFNELLKDSLKFEMLKEKKPDSFKELETLFSSIPGIKLEFKDKVRITFE